MNISLHLVHLRIIEEQDYAAYRLDSKNMVLRACQTNDPDFHFDSCHAISCLCECHLKSVFLHSYTSTGAVEVC